MDIFEKLKSILGCNYISDLRFDPYCDKAKELIKTLDIENCSFAELNDVANYLYGKQFDTKDAVLCFLKG